MASPPPEHLDLHPEDSPTSLHPEDRLILDSFPRSSTKTNTQWSVYSWNTWRSGVNAQLENDAEKIPPIFELMTLPYATMDKHIARFTTELKRSNGEEFPLDSIKAVVAGIQRFAKAYATVHNKPVIMFTKDHIQFPEFQKALIEKKQYLDMHNGNQNLNRAIGVDVLEEKALWDTGALNIISAEDFSDTIIFYLIKIFGMVSSSSLQALKIENFVFSEDEHEKYVEIDKDYAKRLLGDHRDSVLVRGRCIETASGHLRHYNDPNNPRTFYNLLKMYIAEIKDITTDHGSLLLMPRRNKYTKHAIGKNTLMKVVQNIMNRANLKGNYTNLSLGTSIKQRLKVFGYNTKMQTRFEIDDHLNICKILDPPPPGHITAPLCIMKTQSAPVVASQTQSAPVIMTQTQIPPAFTSQTQIPPALNSQTRAVFQLGSGQSPSQGPMPGMLQVVNPQHNTNLLTYSKIILPPVMPVSSSSLPDSSVNGGCGGHMCNSVTHVPSTATVTGSTSQPSGATVHGPFPTPGSSITGTHVPITPTVTSSTRQQSGATLLGPFPTPSFSATAALPSTEPLQQQNTVYPLFLHSASSPEDVVACPTNVIKQENGETVKSVESVACPTNDIIKQEPVENNGTEICYHHNNQSDSTEISGQDTIVSQPMETSEKYNCGKRKLETDKSDESANSNDDHPHSKVMRQDSSCNSEEGSSNDGAHNVDIEFAYAHNVNKKTMKQTVSVNSVDQTVFFLTGSMRFGRPAEELELKLGDYLPENSYVKVSDIKLKRVATEVGGKMVLQLKY